MKRHKHYELIVAWANGAQIEAKFGVDDWVELYDPGWGSSTEYRIKPAEKKLTPCWLWANNNGAITLNLYSEYEILKELIDDYPIKLLWSETMLDLGDEE